MTIKTSRRQLLTLGAGAVAAGAMPARAWAEASGTPFSRETVLAEAEALAAAPYKPPPATPKELAQLDYDTYRQIRYRKKEAIWGVSPTRFSIELFAPGFLFRDLIDISIVENGMSRPLSIGDDSFDVPDSALAPKLTGAGKFAGFRLHYPLNQPEYRDEVVVFQGASYFRAVSEGQLYGLSARGLALDVAEPKGEEFPVFHRFWIERPSAQATSIVVHALLDSQSVTGAYRFGIYPGRSTAMDISAVLFPRRRLTHVGLAPLTSMYLHGLADLSKPEDYRPAVHDSELLAMTTGSGEAIVRPLINPETLQASAFMDQNPQGFGLIQRNRSFELFQDLEAHYGRRPSAWIVPKGEWGKGVVQLIEIPSQSEIHDNIVTYWRPAAPLEPGQPFRYAYRLTWPNSAPRPQDVARVVRSVRSRRWSDGLPQVAIDYKTALPASALTLSASVSKGEMQEALLVENYELGGVRAFVTFDPGDAQLVELRVELQQDGRQVGETWLFRWLAG